jgi:hypothetical protein
MKFRVFWDVLPCSQVDADQRIRCVLPPSETSVNINLTTVQYIPEDSKLHVSYAVMVLCNKGRRLAIEQGLRP